jgi:predicted DCC family thiol-disulfide oxidoreductase YuxK
MTFAEPDISAKYPMTLLFDGACPVCSLEMDNFKARNQDGLLVFVDTANPEFDPTQSPRSFS